MTGVIGGVIENVIEHVVYLVELDVVVVGEGRLLEVVLKILAMPLELLAVGNERKGPVPADAKNMPP